MRKVTYLYNDAITNYHFSKQHPMKTKRIKMTHSLIESYNLIPHLTMFESKSARYEQMCSFHSPEYIKYLQTWVIGQKEQNLTERQKQQRKQRKRNQNLKYQYKIDQSFDCPGFDGLYNFCQLAVGSSLDAADLVITNVGDVAINWVGGYHHAKKTQASGFCYVNDIVICILQLLKFYPKVLYLDIDVHHGDGVEEAFYHTNRVMTVSFHQYCQDFFPGTGSLDCVGDGVGKYYSVNIPLKPGIDDFTYYQLFKKVMQMLMGSYRPDALVIQCGADSLSKDRLGHLNLSIKGHAECIKLMLQFGLPTILLGGGGYTIENVSRCWAYETAIAMGQPIQNQIPQKDKFYNFYEFDNYKLHFPIDIKVNQNTQQYLDKIVKTVGQNIRQSQIRPSVPFHNPPEYFLPQQPINYCMISQDQDNSMDHQDSPFSFQSK